MAYDSSSTKDRILAAAAAEFAQHGFAGARVERVAKAARANKRALYDYFGDKHQLFATVLEREMTQCAEAVSVDDGDLAGYAGRLFDYQAAHPEVLRLLMWEALEFGGQHFPARAARTGKYRSRAGAVAAAGVPDETARERLFFTFALVNWGFVAPQMRTMILGEDYDSGQLRAAATAAVAALAAGGAGTLAGAAHQATAVG
jgi:AcrR family transcriptional regulator